MLTTPTVLTLLRWHRAEPHTTLLTTPTWYSQEALRELDERARAELNQVGTVDISVDISIVARPEREYYGWVSTTADGRPVNYSVFAGATGRRGFVLARNIDTEVVVLAAARPEDLLGAFVAQLPHVPAANGPSISLPEAGRRSAVIDSNPGMDKPLLDRVLQLPRTGGGCLYAAERGIRRTVSQPLNYIDTVQGRWLTQRRKEWINCVPATPQLLAARLNELSSRS